jgi:hypothetical protein
MSRASILCEGTHFPAISWYTVIRMYTDMYLDALRDSANFVLQQHFRLKQISGTLVTYFRKECDKIKKPTVGHKSWRCHNKYCSNVWKDGIMDYKIPDGHVTICAAAIIPKSIQLSLLQITVVTFSSKS